MTVEVEKLLHAKSVETGKEIATFVLRYPRAIHGEFMTHRVFGRNASAKGRVVSREVIAARASPTELKNPANYLTVQIGRIRENNPHIIIPIENVRGKGYC